jgi:hypothetical protein
MRRTVVDSLGTSSSGLINQGITYFTLIVVFV